MQLNLPKRFFAISPPSLAQLPRVAIGFVSVFRRVFSSFHRRQPARCKIMIEKHSNTLHINRPKWGSTRSALYWNCSLLPDSSCESPQHFEPSVMDLPTDICCLIVPDALPNSFANALLQRSSRDSVASRISAITSVKFFSSDAIYQYCSILTSASVVVKFLVRVRVSRGVATGLASFSNASAFCLTVVFCTHGLQIIMNWKIRSALRPSR